MHRNYGGQIHCMEMSAFIHYAIFGYQGNIIRLNLEYISQ